LLELDPVFDGPERDRLLDPRDDRPERRRLLVAWLRLHGACCLHPQDALESLERSAGDPARALERVAGRHDPPGAATVERWLATLVVQRFRVLPITSPAYPVRLRALADAAPVLLVRGDPRLLERTAVAIVGSRAATTYGRGMAHALATGLARAGVVVVSGMARGVDACAHLGALEASGQTVAIQACGPDRIYPPEHRGLRERIAATGVVMTELPPGHPPRGLHFPLRNRLISGLVPLVVVVEAREKSGSLITARHALDQGRDVMAVPGPVTSPASSGPNRLLSEGARPVLGVDDLLECLGLEPAHAAQGRLLVEPTSRASLDAHSVALLRLLELEALSRDQLAARLGCSPHQLARSLVELEIGGVIREDRDGRLRVTPGGQRKGDRGARRVRGDGRPSG
jgi:DNA processing protein